MIDQQKISSGYDVEFLMGEEYIKYFLLSSMETGTIPWHSESEVKDEAGNHIRTDATVTHPPQELNEKRLYSVHPDFIDREHPYLAFGITAYSIQQDEFTVTFLQDSAIGADFSVKIYPTIIRDVDHPDLTKVIISNALFVNLEIKFSVDSTLGNDGFLSNVGLKIELLDINGPLITAAEALRDENGNPVFSKAETLASMKDQLDRTTPFSGAGEGKVASIAYKKFFADEETPNAIGIYLNLVLQNGPNDTDFLPARGNIDDAQNFMPKTSRMAFGFAAETYQSLSEDLFQKMAVLKEGSTDEYEYPLKKDDEIIGQIKNISVYPEIIVTNATTTYTNVLVIDLHGEYFVENWFDPDFHVLVRLVPTERNGLFDFDIDVDFRVSALGILLFTEMLLTIVMPKLGLSLFFATLLINKLIEKAGKDYASGFVETELNRSSFLDTIPHKLMVEKRRWDPLYFTTHRLEAAVDDLVVNNHGFAFSANDVFLGKKFEPVPHMVIRAATRNDENILNGLLYRAKDLRPYLNTDLTFIFPAVDRMPFVELLNSEGDIESYRVALTVSQINDRLISEDKGVKDKHLKNIQYLPKKIHVIDNQIYKILAISETEIPEIEQTTRSLLRSELRTQNGTAYREQAETELEQELGRTPLEEEITVRFNTILDQAVSNAFSGRFPRELDIRLKFDLEPFEFADLQKKQFLILGLDKLDIITMNRDDKETVYYRDHERPFMPDADTSDNLLSLPRYVS